MSNVKLWRCVVELIFLNMSLCWSRDTDLSKNDTITIVKPPTSHIVLDVAQEGRTPLVQTVHISPVCLSHVLSLQYSYSFLINNNDS